MFRRAYIERLVSPWLLSVCLMTVGVVALIAALPPFVQRVFADTDTDCSIENPCSDPLCYTCDTNSGSCVFNCPGQNCCHDDNGGSYYTVALFGMKHGTVSWFHGV